MSNNVFQNPTDPEFQPKCTDCHALCCVALTIDTPNLQKPAGVPCEMLDENFGCSIWNELEDRQLFTCRHWSCLSAGQRIAQAVEAQTEGKSWRDDHEIGVIELQEFQKLYMTLHEEIHGKSPRTLSEKLEQQAGESKPVDLNNPFGK